jgi:hypothetical protein
MVVGLTCAAIILALSSSASETTALKSTSVVAPETVAATTRVMNFSMMPSFLLAAEPWLRREECPFTEVSEICCLLMEGTQRKQDSGHLRENPHPNALEPVDS